MVEPDKEVSLSVLPLVHTDISLLQDGRTIEVSVSVLALVHTDILVLRDGRT